MKPRFLFFQITLPLLFSLFLPNQPLSAQGSDCFARFRAAIEKKDLAALEKTARQGCDINVRGTVNDRGDFTPLMWAIQSQNRPAVEWLLARGARVNFPPSEYGPFFLPPLLLAMDTGDADIAAVLLRAGALPDITFSVDESQDCWNCYEDITYLHAVFSAGSQGDSLFRIPELLIRHGADVNAKNGRGQTPLDYAASEGFLGYMTFLLRHGAKPEDGDRAAVVAAAMRSKHEAVSLLVKKGVSKTKATEALLACIDCCGDGFGASITAEDRLKTAEILLKHGADIHLKAMNLYEEMATVSTRRTLLFRPFIAEMLVENGYAQWADFQIEMESLFPLKAVAAAPGGLRLRSFPSLKAPVLAVIPNGERVQALGYAHGETLTVEGRTGQWRYVDWKGKRGFVFEGFLKVGE